MPDLDALLCFYSLETHWIYENPVNFYKKKIFLAFVFFWATPMAYGGSQARGLIGAVTAGLRHSHSKARSEPHLRPTPQLTARPDP